MIRPASRILHPTFLLFTLFLVSATPSPAAEKAESSIERMKKDINFLASEECEGRGVETLGINKAADHIAATFKELGLKPAGADGSYFQPFSIAGPAKLGTPNSLILKGPLGQELHAPANKLFSVSGLSGKGKATAPIVFAGYGLSSKTGYDDYKGIDVRGKIVIVLRATPRASSRESPFPDALNQSPLINKIGNAEERKAAAIFFVSDRSMAGTDDTLMTFDYSRGGGAGSIPIFHIRRTLVDQMLASAGTTLAELEGDISRELKPRSFEVHGWTST